MRPLPAIEKVKRLGVDVHRQCEILCGAHDTQGLFDLEGHVVSTSWRPAENHRRRLTLYSAVPRYWNGSYFGEAQGAAVLIETESAPGDRKSTRLNSSHLGISYAVFC